MPTGYRIVANMDQIKVALPEAPRIGSFLRTTTTTREGMANMKAKNSGSMTLITRIVWYDTAKLRPQGRLISLSGGVLMLLQKAQTVGARHSEDIGENMEAHQLEL